MSTKKQSGPQYDYSDVLRFAPELRKIKQCPDELTSELSNLCLPIGTLNQFRSDCQLYNMYEALCMLCVEDDSLRDAVAYKALSFVNYKHEPLVLPVPEIDLGIHHGVVKQTPKVFGPDSTWEWNKEAVENIEITDQLCEYLKGQMSLSWLAHNQHSVRSMIRQYGLWQFVKRIDDANSRLRCMAGLIKKFKLKERDILMPKVKHEFFQVPEPVREKRKTVMTDTKGNHWHWNCGWGIITPEGIWKHPSKPLLGHTTFRRVVKLASDSNDFFRKSRPYGDWRNVNELMDHSLYGRVRVKLTDGQNAIIELPDGSQRETVWSHCQRIKVIGHRPGSSLSHKQDKTGMKKTKPKKEVKSELLDAFLQAMLAAPEESKEQIEKLKNIE